MTEHPILFSSAMVRAILAGTKTQTRRLVRGPDWSTVESRADLDENMEPIVVYYTRGDIGERREVRCPYAAQHTLWVRETWAGTWNSCPWSNMPHAKDPVSGNVAVWREAFERDGRCQPSWRPSIFMPRWASRITLTVTDVRVERLQDISGADAKAEGVEPIDGIYPDGSYRRGLCSRIPCYRDGFSYSWDRIYRKRGSWASNPWVWVVTFERTGP